MFRNLMTMFAASMLTPLAAFGLEFAWLTDIHVGRGNVNSSLVEQAVAEINASDAEFVILSGDLTNTGGREELEYAKSLLDRLEKPLYVIPGNHETTWNDFLSYSFREVFRDDRFCFRSGNNLFIGIASGPWYAMGDGYVKKSDLRWLAETLKCEFRPGDQVILVCHYPLNMDLSNAQKVLDVIRPYPVLAVLSGHYHELGLYNVENIGNATGRAISLRHSEEDRPGYNLVTIADGQLKIYDKSIGSPRPESPFAVLTRNFSGGENITFRPPETAAPPPELSFTGENDGDGLEPEAHRRGSLRRSPAASRDGLTAFGCWDTNLYVMDDSGNIRWQWNNGSPNPLYAPFKARPVIGKRNLAIVAPDRYLTIFDRETGEVKLRTNQYKFRESLGAASDGRRAYAKTMDGELAVIDVDAAEILKVIDLGIGYDHTPVAPIEISGDVLAAGRQGDLVRVNPETGEIKWRYRCGETAFSRFDDTGDAIIGTMVDGKVWKVLKDRPAKR